VMCAAMRAIKVTVLPPTEQGRLYPRYDIEAQILEVSSRVPRSWPFGIDIDGCMTLPKKGQREQAQAGCTRGIGHRSARTRVQREAPEESTGRFQAFPLAFWLPSSA